MLSGRYFFPVIFKIYGFFHYEYTVNVYENRPLEPNLYYISYIYTYNIKVDVNILITLPVTTATGEKYFSTTRRHNNAPLKHLFKCFKCQVRLNGLALLNIHCDIYNTNPKMAVGEMAKNLKTKNLS